MFHMAYAFFHCAQGATAVARHETDSASPSKAERHRCHRKQACEPIVSGCSVLQCTTCATLMSLPLRMNWSFLHAFLWLRQKT